MIQNTNKNGIVKHADIIFSSVDNFSQKTELKNKGLLAAVASFLFNFSVSVFEKNIENKNVISTFAKLLKIRLEIDGGE